VVSLSWCRCFGGFGSNDTVATKSATTEMFECRELQAENSNVVLLQVEMQCTVHCTWQPISKASTGASASPQTNKFEIELDKAELII
jgi:hypothetical protein